MLVMNVVSGLSVEDLSERAIAHLGYEKMKWHETVYPGDTITSKSPALSKRYTSRPDRGVVKFRTTGYNQRGEKVLEDERPVPIRKRNPPNAQDNTTPGQLHLSMNLSGVRSASLSRPRSSRLPRTSIARKRKFPSAS